MPRKAGVNRLALTGAFALLISLAFIFPKVPPNSERIVGEPKALVRSGTLRVARVIDGDTFVLSDGRHVRLLGLDTPEDGEPFYQEAKAFADSAVGSKSIRLETSGFAEDKYGRILVYLYVDSILCNEKIIRAGLARVYLFNRYERYASRFIVAQRQARHEKRGIWSLAEPEKEKYYIAPASSFRFHRPLCPSIKNANFRKARRFNDRGSALDQGFSPCRNCRP